MRAIKILLISSLLFSANLFAQEAETAPAPTNLDKLLELVKEGRTKNSLRMISEKLNLKLQETSKMKF